MHLGSCFTKSLIQALKNKISNNFQTSSNMDQTCPQHFFLFGIAQKKFTFIGVGLLCFYALFGQ
jgi:hypothetical protein